MFEGRSETTDALSTPTQVLAVEIERVRNDDFRTRAEKQLERDREILDRRAK